MKHYTKLFFAAAVAALGLASCAKEVAQVETPKDNLVTVHFGATAGIEGATKATLTPDEQETLFTSAWENGDEIFIQYENDETTATPTSGTWNGTKFEATMPSHTGMWEYTACYPNSANAEISFGSNRTQKGNLYNSNYDVMIAPKISCDHADAGKDDSGNDVVFNMERKTGIVYFHLKSELNNEDVISAKLSVEGGNIASSYALLDHSGFTCEEDLKEITITFEEGTAPKASDFQLWYNVLPTMYTKMTLTVETTGHTMTISRNAPNINEYLAGKLYKVVKEIPAEKWVKRGGGETPVVESWIATDLADITATDEVVITMAKGESVYALTSAKGSSAAPTAVAVTVENKELTATPADNLVWNVANADGTLTIYPKGQTTTWLYTTNTNNGVRVGTNDNKTFVVDPEFGYLKNTTTNRYLGVYNNSDWRCYTSATGTSNIADQTLCFYVKGTPKTALETPANLQVNAEKVVSWDAVSGAASYNVTIGTETFTSETNSYKASALADEYYDVTVVAVPSDKDNYKNSAAATLTGVKFGTPTLATPELTEGAIDETSIRVNMAVDSRATNGCTCEIYNGETLVESKTIKVKYVVFSGLESGVTYTIKVNAIAVDGEKPYAASDVASIELKTKPAQHVSDVTEVGNYTIKGLTAYAVATTNVVIAGDNTGYILVFKRLHGLNVGNTFDAAGSTKLYKGVWEFEDPSITNIKNGETPIFPNAVEATEDYLNAYASSQRIQYVHIKGIQTGKYIEVGGTKVFMETPNTEMEGKVVDAYGFVYGYHTTYNNAFFVVTSIKEDQTIPTLSVDQTSKVWAADATDAFVVNVAVNSEGGDWTVTPETLSWATIAVDKAAGTITVTPNGANTAETANEAKLTVAHASDASLTKEISLKQNAAGAVMEKSEKIILANGKFVDNTITWSGTSCSFVQTKGTSNMQPNENYISAPRWYQNNVITFKAKVGCKISKVVVTCVNGRNDNYKYVNALKGSTYSPKEATNATASGTEVTITTAGDFTITMGAQSRISSVVVYYTD